MIKIFTSNSSTGSKQAIQFFKDNSLDYIEKNVSLVQMTKEDLVDILSLTENGFEDIISENSKSFQKIKKNFEDKTFEEALRLITENSECISRPIMVQYINEVPKRLLIGYNSNDIEIFLRKEDI